MNFADRLQQETELYRQGVEFRDKIIQEACFVMPTPAEAAEEEEHLRVHKKQHPRERERQKRYVRRFPLGTPVETIDAIFKEALGKEVEERTRIDAPAAPAKVENKRQKKTSAEQCITAGGIPKDWCGIKKGLFVTAYASVNKISDKAVRDKFSAGKMTAIARRFGDTNAFLNRWVVVNPQEFDKIKDAYSRQDVSAATVMTKGLVPHAKFVETLKNKCPALFATSGTSGSPAC